MKKIDILYFLGYIGFAILLLGLLSHIFLNIDKNTSEYISFTGALIIVFFSHLIKIYKKRA